MGGDFGTMGDVTGVAVSLAVTLSGVDFTPRAPSDSNLETVDFGQSSCWVHTGVGLHA